MKKLLSLLLVIVMGLTLTACSKSNSAGNKNTAATDTNTIESTVGATPTEAAKSVITVTFRDDGQGENGSTWKWLQTAYDSFDKKDSCELNIAPITASEGDYFAKIALSLQSEETAPDLVTEDTFQLATDVEAGYLTPLDDYLADYADWTDGSYYDSLKEGVTAADGKVYGVPFTTDTRGLWYNKEIFKKAGLPEDWDPKTWDDILAACKKIKDRVPDVIPFWCNSAVATGEATSMQTYEMLLYGTGEKLIDESTGKWVISSQGILDSLSFLDNIYKNNFGPPLSKVLNGQASNTSAREYLPQGKLAISLDGNWITGNYLETGASPWPEYKVVLGFTAMPTENGDGSGTVTLAGGWGWSIPAKSDNKDITMEFIKHLMEPSVYIDAIIETGGIGTRADIAEDERYSKQPFIATATKFLQDAAFRPKDSKYSAVSTSIQTMVESVVSGTSPEDAMATYAVDVTRTVGENNVVSK
ncbi:extracellular solute-binding protein [Anaerocolumna sedimenticola]|uniref:Extracellular solute-binding protein n=1 Tax=Anaerocolumna sedimenticola TaxID=2696063 RepID=A0A6P1TKI0_9FIRM|nr:extracellular solute-binding protein [Anaerocolumna sedimenticola]QHQ60797.1 extracellular solute-binding protein [Anaerocolumna sedimenticola]